jgi:hypothetical protein
MGAMRKVFAWLGAATLYMLVSVRADAANDVLKPYVVLILDTSDSMLIPTGSGPTSCGKVDNRLNHAVCAINNIVQSYGDMVFALGRYRETSSGTFTTSCDANGDQDGNAQATLSSSPSLIAPPGGGDQCNTQGAVCGDCNSATGTNKTCTLATQTTDCLSDICNTAIEASCASSGNPLVGVDDDNDGFVNDGCPTVGAVETNCADNVDNDGDGAVNDGCPTVNQCGGTFGCTNSDRNFELLAPLVDGGNASAAKFVDGTCGSCDPKVGDPELWGVGNTFTPVSGTLLGAKRYWEGRQATDLTEIWNPAAAGYDPINRDPSNNVFLTATATTTCSANPTSCVIVSETNCGGTGGAGGTAADDDVTGSGVSVPDGAINDGCPASGPPETACNDNIDNDSDGFVNDGCPAVCNGTNCCCAQQCRPYITIMLADGDETCTSFSNTTESAASMLDTRPHSDAVAVSALSRNGTVGTATTSATSPFAVGDSIVVSAPSSSTFNGTFTVQTVSGSTVTYNDTRASGTAGNLTGATVAHVAGSFTYRVVTKPIGFGVSVPNANIEALAHAGGAPDLPGVNEGYYAADEADLQLAISDILSDSVRSELCNNKDDDCDTRIDEDFPQIGSPPGTNAQACPALCDTDGNPNTPKTTCLGKCANTGTFVCDGTGSVACSAVPAATPSAEVCNNIDDDCNGLVDDGIVCNSCIPKNELCNGVAESCGDCPADQARHCSGNATKTCRTTADCGADGTCGACQVLTRPCSIGTGVGQCSGVEQCVAGSYSTATSSAVTNTEVCDGIDNDCDGICDGIELECSQISQACNSGNPATCPGSANPGSANHIPAPIPENICRPGARACDVKAVCGGGGSFSSCVGEVLPCGPDTAPGTAGCDGCDGLDNDCDNAIDENFIASDCSNNCGVGTTQCMNGQITCNSAPGTNGDKTCNNVDDDCDNLKDEDWMCGDPNSVPFVPCACGAGVVCDGVSVCSNGAVQCQGGPINTEVCNCLDDDCDGTTDEDPSPSDDICPGGATCVPGSCQCAFGCVESEFPCPVGKKCDIENRCSEASDEPYKLCNVAGDCANGTCDEAKFCVNDPCFDVTCAPVNGNLTTCQPKAGFPNESECVDICSLINDGDATAFPPCPSGFVCLGSAGECRPNNCTTFPDMCTESQSCVNGTCVSNPCTGVTCETGKYCIGGECVPSCSDVTCATGQRCRQGTCEPDPCAEHCPYGEVCNDSSGQCIEDPCKVRNCPSGQWCNPNDGQCEDDPCVTSDISCPNAGEVCRGGTCIDEDDLRPDAAGESHVTVGGGGGCNTTGGGSGLLLALGLLLVRRRRTLSPRKAREGGAL